MIPSPLPTEPCLFFYRVHQLHSGKGLKTDWARTTYVATAHGHPYDFQVSGSQGRRWMPNHDQASLYHLSHVSARAGMNPHPNTLYEVVRVPTRLLPKGLPDFRVREIVDNIRPDILRGLRREQHGELEDVFIDKLPATDMEASAFYVNGASFHEKIHQWSATAVAVTASVAPAAAPAAAAPAGGQGAGSKVPVAAATRPSTAHKALAARRRPPHTTDPHRLLQTVKQLRRIKQGGQNTEPTADETAEAAPTPPTTSKMSGP